MKAKAFPLKLPSGLLPKVKALPTEQIPSHLCELQELQATNPPDSTPRPKPNFQIGKPENDPIPPNNFQSSYIEAVSVQEIHVTVWESVTISL